MKTYHVMITSTEYGFYAVEADSEEEAKELVMNGECDNMYTNKQEIEITGAQLANDTDIPS